MEFVTMAIIGVVMLVTLSSAIDYWRHNHHAIDVAMRNK